MKDKDKKSNKLLIACIVGFSVLVGGVTLLIFSMFSQRETRTSTTRQDSEMGVLECKAIQPEGAFFKGADELNSSHKVKVMMRDDKPTEVSFEYVGNYNGEEKAQAANAKLHADYNIYMGAEAEKLSPVFGAYDLTARVNVYAAAGKLNSLNAKIFFLTTEEMMDFYNMSRTSIEKLYKGKGFNCSYNK